MNFFNSLKLYVVNDNDYQDKLNNLLTEKETIEKRLSKIIDMELDDDFDRKGPINIIVRMGFRFRTFSSSKISSTKSTFNFATTPIISREVWDKAQEIANKRKEAHTINKQGYSSRLTNKYAFSGKIK